MKVIDEKSTRQLITITTRKSVEELNKMINNFFKINKFSLENYNEEKVFIHNDIMSYLFDSVNKARFKVIINPNKVIIISWIKRGNTEYGFDDNLNLNPTYNESANKYTKVLYSLSRNLVNGIKDFDSTITCEKIKTTQINTNETNNLYVPNLESNEKRKKNLFLEVVLNIISIPLYFISPIFGIALPLISISTIYKFASYKNQNTSTKIVFLSSIVLLIIYFAIYLSGIISQISSL